MIALSRIAVLIIGILASIDSNCLDFASSFTSIENSCRLNENNATDGKAYEKCLRCTLSHAPIVVVEVEDECRLTLECIELKFASSTLFETFFAQHRTALAELYQISNGSQSSRKSLYLDVLHDQYDAFSLKYMQSILQANGRDYSFLRFSLHKHRQALRVDLNATLADIPLHSIRITIVCSVGVDQIYEINSIFQPIVYPNVCSPLTRNRTLVRVPSLRARLTLVGGLSLATIALASICVCLCMRLSRWRTDDRLHQRASIVPSMLSTDTTDSRNADGRFAELKSTMSTHSGKYGVYAFHDEF